MDGLQRFGMKELGCGLRRFRADASGVGLRHWGLGLSFSVRVFSRRTCRFTFTETNRKEVDATSTRHQL